MLMPAPQQTPSITPCGHASATRINSSISVWSRCAGFWPVPINLLAAVGTLLGVRLLLLATARATQDSGAAWDPTPRKRHAGGKGHTPAVDPMPQNISSCMHYLRWQGQPDATA